MDLKQNKKCKLKAKEIKIINNLFNTILIIFKLNYFIVII